MIQVIRQLTACLDAPKELVKVTYLHFSMVEADMLCFQQLATIYKHWQWKYVLILCGKELPFGTNRMIVDSLQQLNGASLINVHDLTKPYYNARFRMHYHRHPDNGSLLRLDPGKLNHHLV